MKKNKSKGDIGENRAAHFLTKNGYEIIERNWRKQSGEIDIIATINDTIIFCEVKTWPNGSIDSIEKVINQRKQKRMIETAKLFIDSYRQYSNSFIRFDLLLIDMPQFPEQVYQIENAFSEIL
ncbi:MAG: YraN family protein [Treponemataceae bacterium]